MKILIADDQIETCQSFKKLLDWFGHQVCICSDAKEVMRKVEELQPDVLLLDLAMPEMSGFAIMDKIGQAVELRPKVVIAISGLSHLRSSALSAGFDDFLVKPVSATELVTSIEAQIELHRSNEARSDS